MTSVALVHDWFTILGGAEKVVKELVGICPQSEVFTVFNLTSGGIEEIVGNRPVHVSSLNSLPGVSKYYRYLLPLAVREVERFDLSGFDVVVSSSAAIAKGVLTGPDQRHVAYVHSPARYAWDLTHEYLRAHNMKGFKGILAREMLHQFRNWDVRTCNSIDTLVANSDFVRRRIWNIYRREAQVVYPPVDIARFQQIPKGRRHFVTATRLVDYKRVDLIVDAFSSRPDLKLVVIGEGPEFARLKSKASTNIEFVGRVSDEEMLSLYSEARAFIFAALEDFGISPVEAQAAGLPVIALAKGGTAETVIDGETGVGFAEQTVSSLTDAIERFEKIEHKLTSERCVANASRFSVERFRQEMSRLIFDTDSQVHLPLRAPP